MTKSSPSATKTKAVKADKTTAKASKPSSKAKTDTKQAIYLYVCEQHALGIEEVNKMDVSLAVGYKNPRSENFAHSLKALIEEDDLIAKGSGKETLVLTKEGVDNMPKDLKMTSSDPKKVHERYIEVVEKKVKIGAAKVRPCWEILSDFKVHTINDTAKALGYGNPRSFANTKIIPVMKDMGLVEDVGKDGVKFTSKLPKI